MSSFSTLHSAVIEDDNDNTVIMLDNKTNSNGPTRDQPSRTISCPLSKADTLVNAALPLLSLGAAIGGQPQVDVSLLHKRVTREIKRFEEHAKKLGTPEKHVLGASYVLCAFLDEVVTNSSWGAHSLWPKHTLLNYFHRAQDGGQKVFYILEKLMEQPRKNEQLLTVFYYCLDLGFQGKYRLNSEGRTQLTNIRHDVFLALSSLSPTPPPLSPKIQKTHKATTQLSKHTYKLAACVFAAMGLGIAAWHITQN